MTLLFLAALGVGIVLFILFPVFARYGELSERPDARARRQKSLTEQKERLYEAIQDLDFEYRAGKLSETDYQSVRSDLVSQAAAVNSQLDEIVEPSVETKAEETPAEAVAEEAPADDEVAAEGPVCRSCHRVNPPGAKFCFHCGESMAAPASCPECGTELPKEARFCTSCGVAIPA